jgi:hypothetical protein
VRARALTHADTHRASCTRAQVFTMSTERLQLTYVKAALEDINENRLSKFEFALAINKIMEVRYLRHSPPPQPLGPTVSHPASPSSPHSPTQSC